MTTAMKTVTQFLKSKSISFETDKKHLYGQSYDVISFNSPKILDHDFLKFRVKNARLATDHFEIEAMKDPAETQKMIANLLVVDKLLSADLLRSGGNHESIKCVFTNESAEIAEGNRRWRQFLNMNAEDRQKIERVQVEVWFPNGESAEELAWAIEEQKHNTGAKTQDHDPFQKLYGLDLRIKHAKLDLKLPDSFDDSTEADNQRAEAAEVLQNRFPGIHPRVTNGYVDVYPLFEQKIIPHLTKLHKQTGCPMGFMLKRCRIDWIRKLMGNPRLCQILIREKRITIEELIDMAVGKPFFNESRNVWCVRSKKFHNNDFLTKENLHKLIDRCGKDNEKIEKVISHWKSCGTPGLSQLYDDPMFGSEFAPIAAPVVEDIPEPENKDLPIIETMVRLYESMAPTSQAFMLNKLKVVAA